MDEKLEAARREILEMLARIDREHEKHRRPLIERLVFIENLQERKYQIIVDENGNPTGELVRLR